MNKCQKKGCPVDKFGADQLSIYGVPTWLCPAHVIAWEKACQDFTRLVEEEYRLDGEGDAILADLKGGVVERAEAAALRQRLAELKPLLARAKNGLRLLAVTWLETEG